VAAWKIRTIEPGDLPQVNELFATVFGFARPVQHDAWKFQKNPDGGHLGMVAVDGDKIVGQYALWPVRMLLGSEEILGAQSLDTMTHPDYRKQGMLGALATACMQEAVRVGVEALYGFAGTESYYPLVANLNWDHVGDVHRWVRPLKASLHPKVPAPAGWALEASMRLWPSRRDAAVRIETGAPANEEIQALYASWPYPKGTCRVNRRPEWMRWRTALESGHDYEWVRTYRGDALVGLAIWGKSIARTTSNLLELKGVTAHDLDVLLAEVVRRAGGSGRSFMSTFETDARVRKALRRAGFVRAGILPFITRSMTPRVLKGNIHVMASWQISGIDLDTV
jgi:predicted N-acetyltransferase YhbS